MVAASFQLREFVDAAKKAYPVDPNEIYVMGFSQGGVMAYDLVLQSPAEFRALIAMSSWLPGEIAARIPATPEHAALPTLVIHGENDPMIPVERAHESRARLEALGIHTVGDLVRADSRRLDARFGAWGLAVARLARAVRRGQSRGIRFRALSARPRITQGSRRSTRGRVRRHRSPARREPR